MAFSRLYTVVFLTVFWVSGVSAQWQKIFSPPPGTGFSRFQTLTYKNGTLWALNLDTLFYTRDDGLTWNVASPEDSGETFLDVSFFDDNIGLLTTTKRVFITHDAGFVWDTIYRQNNAVWSAKFIGSPQDIAVAIDRAVICSISRDGGATWKTTQFSGYKQVTDLKTLPSGEVSVLLLAPGTTGTKIATTTDYGNTWKYSSGVDYDCFTFQYEPCDSSMMYVINEEELIPSDLTAMLYISNDHGGSWRTVGPTSDLSYYSGSLSVSPGSVIFLHTLSNGVLRSADDGLSWGSIGGPNGIPDTRLVAAATDFKIYAADRSGNIWMTTNAGGVPLTNPRRDKLVVIPKALFEKKKVSLCDSLLDTLHLLAPVCPKFSLLSLACQGVNSKDYTIIRNDGDTTIVILFKPLGTGMRTANIALSLSNGVTQIVPLNGEGITPGYTVTFLPSKLFETDSLTPCVSITRSFHILTKACVYPAVASEQIVGGQTGEYTILTKLPSILTGNDSVAIRFTPSRSGARWADYVLRLSDNKQFALSLRGTGLDTAIVLEALPRELFSGDSLDLCHTLERQFVLRSNVCYPRFVSTEKISGIAAGDYSLVRSAPNPLTGNDTIAILFKPGVAGLRDARYDIVLSDGNGIGLDLKGTGIDTGYYLAALPLSLFDNDTVELCSSLTRSFVVFSDGCNVNDVDSESIVRTVTPQEYSLASLLPAKLSGIDTVKITFSPVALGASKAEYRLAMKGGRKIRIPLGGFAKNAPYTISSSPKILFATDSLLSCEDADDTLTISLGGCAILHVASEEIIGNSASEYSIVKRAPDSLVNMNSVAIHFSPKLIGLRDASYRLVLDDGKKILVPLAGYGSRTLLLMLETQQTFTTPIIGDDIRVPVFVRGMERPETVELSLRFDRDLAYHGTFSLRGTPLDISGSTTANSSRIRIPASELKPNEISAYADFSVYVDTVMVSRIDIDSLAVVSAQAPCQYITDTRTYALISGPSDCGSVTISNYLRYGRMPMFEIYPNPASGSFTIVSSEALGMARVEIADKIGIVHRSEQVLLGERGSSVKFDAGGLASGLYFVRIIAGPFNTALPVVIEK